MVYKAQVIDNSQFLTTGKIRVRIAKHYYGNLVDLSDFPEKIREGLYYNENNELKHYDSDVFVFSPIGGGNDYGMFFMPQVNTEGIVLMLGDPADTSNEFLWLGSIFEMKDKTVKMPSDSMNNINGLESGSFNNEIINGALVLKLRSTQLDNVVYPEGSKDDLNWKKSPIENLIVINKNRILIEHCITDANKQIIGNSILSMDENGASITTVGEDYNGNISLNANGSFKLETSNTSDENMVSIIGNDEGIEMLSSNGSDTTLITQEPDAITLSSKGTAIGIKNDAITLKSKTAVYLDAPSIRLGPDNLKVVLCPADVKTIPLSEGLVLSTSDVIYG